MTTPTPPGDERTLADTLDEDTAPRDPITLFGRWLEDAERAGLPMARVMTLATASARGEPSARIVALRGFGAEGFEFVSDEGSRKSRDLRENPRAAAVVYWPLGPIGRQVRISGPVRPLADGEVDAIYGRRQREHQLMDWASRQGQVISGRDVVTRARDEARERFAGGTVSRPPHYVGARLAHEVIEFWQGREDRLHDRLRYTRQADGAYAIARLAP